MADTDRDNVLMDFQACTGIEDIESAIQVLEANQWNLLDSINAVMPHLGSQALPSESGAAPPPPPRSLPNSGSGSFDNPIAVGFTPPTGSNHSPKKSTASTSVSTQEPRWRNLAYDFDEAGPSQIRSRFLNFSVDYRDRTIPLVISDGDSVGRMKDILADEVKMPVGSLDLKGWKKDVTDRTILRDLHLPKENRLFLLTPEVSSANDWGEAAPNEEPDQIEMLDRLQLTFALHITVDVDEPASQSSPFKNPVKLQMPGSKTVREVMSDVFDLTNIPVRHQHWKGWPPECLEDVSTTLAGGNIHHPIHELTLTRKRNPSNESAGAAGAAAAGSGAASTSDLAASPTRGNRVASESAFSDDSDMDLEPPFMEEDFGTFHSNKVNPLMPDGDVLSETQATEHFAAEFISRYGGEVHPVFFIGSLDEAVKNSCAAPIRERRPLAIYLHHDGSVLVNVFCARILCAESVVNFLSNNYLTWGWDLTHEANKAKLLTMVTRHFGSVAASTIRNYRHDDLPLLIVITRQRGINEVSTVIQGNSTLDELMMNLIASHEVFAQTIQVEMDEELQREERERVRNEQEIAFQESLAIDRAKEEKKKEEENRAKQEQEREELMRIAEKKREEHEKELRTAIQRSIQDILPDEPDDSTTEPISRIRIRKPDGEFLPRRFLAAAPLVELFQFIASKGFPIEEYKILSSWPRRDLSNDPSDLRKTFKELDLCPQETLFLEER